MSARQRDHRATYARRNERARREGFRSYEDKRRHGGASAAVVRNDRELGRLPRKARQERRRSIRALADLREGRTLDQAIKRNHTTEDAVRFWTRGAVEPDGRVQSSDRLWRPLRAIDADTRSVVPVDVRGSRTASKLSRYWEAVETYRDTGDEGPLREFRGTRVAGIELETNPDVIDYLALIGELSFETIYQDVAA